MWLRLKLFQANSYFLFLFWLPEMATSNEKVDEELVNYLLSLSDDDDYTEEEDLSEHLNDEDNSDSDNSDIVMQRKRPRVIEESEQLLK